MKNGTPSCGFQARNEGSRTDVPQGTVELSDNLLALNVNQKRGFMMAQLHPGAMDRGRQVKPDVPSGGSAGIPLQDVLKSVLVLDGP
jgi:hypothetical protein